MTEDEQKEFEEFKKWKQENAKKEAEVSKKDKQEKVEEIVQQNEQIKIENENRDVDINKLNPQENNTEKKLFKNTPEENTNKVIVIVIAVFVLIAIIAVCFKTCSDNSGKKTSSNITQFDSDSIAVIKDVEHSINKAKQDSIDKVQKAENSKIAAKIKPKLKFRYDDIKEVTWVEPKNKPRYVDENSVYCYFAIKNGRPQNFRLCIQYTADDWLFIESYKFKIDNLVFDYTPNKINRDSDTNIWEWSDEAVDAFNAGIINAIVGAKHVKVLFIGQQYDERRSLSSKELQGIKDITRYYKAIGGEL